MRRAADEHAHAQADEHATGAAAAGVLAGCRWLCAEEAEAVAPGIRLPHGALLCPSGCVVDAPAYLRRLWRLVQVVALSLTLALTLALTPALALALAQALALALAPAVTLTLALALALTLTAR